MTTVVCRRIRRSEGTVAAAPFTHSPPTIATSERASEGHHRHRRASRVSRVTSELGRSRAGGDAGGGSMNALSDAFLTADGTARGRAKVPAKGICAACVSSSDRRVTAV